MCVCLNPVIQKTLVHDRIHRGEVNRTGIWRIDVAGKGICPTRILTQLGEQATCFTQLGGPTLDWFLAMGKADGLSIEWVDSGTPVRFCTTLIEKDFECATELVEEATPVSAGTRERVLERFSQVVSGHDAVLLSGTVAAGFGLGMLLQLAREARAKGSRVYLDIKGKDLEECLAVRPVIAKPNLEELALTCGVPYKSVTEETSARALVEKAGREYFDTCGTCLVITRGSSPTLFWDGSRLGDWPVNRVRAVNPIGSGDAFGAGLARVMERGGSLEEAVAEGTRLGGLNAETLKPGSIIGQDH